MSDAARCRGSAESGVNTGLGLALLTRETPQRADHDNLAFLSHLLVFGSRTAVTAFLGLSRCGRKILEEQLEAGLPTVWVCMLCDRRFGRTRGNCCSAGTSGDAGCWTALVPGGRLSGHGPRPAHHPHPFRRASLYDWPDAGAYPVGRKARKLCAWNMAVFERYDGGGGTRFSTACRTCFRGFNGCRRLTTPRIFSTARSWAWPQRPSTSRSLSSRGRCRRAPGWRRRFSSCSPRW